MSTPRTAATGLNNISITLAALQHSATYPPYTATETVATTTTATVATPASTWTSLLWVPYVLIAVLFVGFLGANFWCYHRKHRERYLRQRDEKRVKDGLHERRRITALMRSRFQAAFTAKHNAVDAAVSTNTTCSTVTTAVSEEEEACDDYGTLAPVGNDMIPSSGPQPHTEISNLSPSHQCWSGAVSPGEDPVSSASLMSQYGTCQINGGIRTVVNSVRHVEPGGGSNGAILH